MKRSEFLKGSLVAIALPSFLVRPLLAITKARTIEIQSFYDKNYKVYPGDFLRVLSVNDSKLVATPIASAYKEGSH